MPRVSAFLGLAVRKMFAPTPESVAAGKRRRKQREQNGPTSADPSVASGGWPAWRPVAAGRDAPPVEEAAGRAGGGAVPDAPPSATAEVPQAWSRSAPTGPLPAGGPALPPSTAPLAGAAGSPLRETSWEGQAGRHRRALSRLMRLFCPPAS